MRLLQEGDTTNSLGQAKADGGRMLSFTSSNTADRSYTPTDTASAISATDRVNALEQGRTRGTA